jgi:acyl-CoA thioester hydrolase
VEGSANVRHTYLCSVRWGDMDAFGHVNNVVWADYLQEARADMLRLHARGSATGALLEGTIVVSQRLRYVAPLVFDGRPVSVEVWVAELKAATFTLAYEVFREAADGARTVYLRAHTVLAPYVFSEERPRRLSPAEREQLAAYLPAPGEEAPIEPVAWGQPRHTDEGHAQVTVRFSDVDIYGHANNVIYLEYFQEGRIQMMANQRLQAGANGPADAPGIVVAQQEVGYKRPMLMRPEPYDTWTWTCRLGRTSMVLEAEITDPLADGAVMARGQVVLVFVDRATGAPTPPTEALAEVIRAALA